MKFKPTPTLTQAAHDVLLRHTGGNESVAALLWSIYQTQPIHLDYDLRLDLYAAVGDTAQVADTTDWENTPAGNTGQAVVLPGNVIYAWGNEHYTAASRVASLNHILAPELHRTTTTTTQED